MDPHRLAERRSLAYHRVVAERIARDPGILEGARARVRAWREGGMAPHYALAWERILGGSPDEVVKVLLSDDQEARALRQATPFAGALDARERWRLWREERQRWERSP